MSAILLGILNAQVQAAPAAAGSYDLLATEILTSSQASVTFSSLGDYAADYQHLQIRMVALHSNSQNSVMQFNGDTSSNYSWHQLQGNGSSVTSYGTSDSWMQVGFTASSTTIPVASVIDILDPFETTKYPTIKTLTGSATSNIKLMSGSWRNTNSLTSILLKEISGSYRSGSRFSLYGIRSA